MLINVINILQHCLGTFDGKKMNNLYDLYLAYLGKRNLYGEVTRFRIQENHSENFEAVMKWLMDLIKLCEATGQSKITTDIYIKTAMKNVKVKANVIREEYHIYSWEW